MYVFNDIESIRKQRWERPASTWGLVPTMGFLHEGHLNLVRRARQENDRVAVSIFVNPAQFNNASDLENYPRDKERDLQLLSDEGADLVWTPSRESVYPAGFQTYIDVEAVSRPLEGAARPGHFRGVATVVAKLFNVFQPHNVYFGQKDAQQVAVIRQMIADLNFNLELIVCPTIRERDGLAMSSRNARLSTQARRQATSLFRALQAGKAMIDAGERNAAVVRQKMTALIELEPLARIDYVSLADPKTLVELERIDSSVLLSLAVFVDGIRLIDNIIIENIEN